MAKCTIIIEDKPDGTFSFVSDPKFETLARMVVSGHDLSDAEGCALFVANQVSSEYRGKSGPTKLLIPKVKNLF